MKSVPEDCVAKGCIEVSIFLSGQLTHHLQNQSKSYEASSKPIDQLDVRETCHQCMYVSMCAYSQYTFQAWMNANAEIKHLQRVK